ncbi:hypothetical protein CYG68_11110 [Morganella morganii]|uniref:Integrase catalytic domain-containing protein n=1 Tax=Morganella morganii TaxID=582 RepID=A0A8I0U8U9_MORMO|nr:hypothetical protein [Morganella morganii]
MSIKISKLICSTSSKGNCYDNTCTKSYFHSLKVELIHGERFSTNETMKVKVFIYIEVDSSAQHSGLYQSPMPPSDARPHPVKTHWQDGLVLPP